MTRTQAPNHVFRSSEFMVAAPVQEVLPLFGPARESEWADGWQPRFVTDGWQPGDPPREGLVFTVGCDEQHQIWTLLRFDGLPSGPADVSPPYRVEYLRIQPGSHVARIRIAVTPVSKDRTRVQVRYDFTALTDAGLAYLAGFDEGSFRTWIATWAVAIEHYLQTGEILPGGH